MVTLLGRSDVDRTSSFFELGGDSLLGLQLVSRLVDRHATDEAMADELQAELLMALFDVGTAEALAAVLPDPIETDRSGTGWTTEGERTSAPMSFSDDRMWLLHSRYPDQAAYNIVNLFEIDGVVDDLRLERAILRVVSRHEALRTTFDTRAPTPTKYVSEQARAGFTVENVATRSEAERRAAVRAATPLDIVDGPPVAGHVYRYGDGCLLLLLVHHAAADGWSMGVFFDEVSACYNSPDRTELGEPTPYSAFASEQRKRRNERAIDWWGERLVPLPEPLDLDLGMIRPPSRTFVGDVVTTGLSTERAKTIEALARRFATTKFTILITVYALALHRLTRRERFIIGTVTAGRDRPAYESIIGFCTNTLPILIDLEGVDDVAEFTRRIHRWWADAFARQSVPFEEIVSRVRGSQDQSRTPLLDAVIVLQNTKSTSIRLDGCRVRRVELHGGTARFDLMTEVVEAPSGFVVNWEYATEVVGAETVKGLASTMDRILGLLDERSDVTIDECCALTAPEAVAWRTLNQTASATTHERVLGLFEARAEARPRDVAVIEAGHRLTYEEFDRRARVVAERLSADGVRGGSTVALVLPRSANALAAVLATWRLGAHFVFIDPDGPDPVRQRLIEATGPAVVVTVAPGDRAELRYEPLGKAAPAGDDEIAYLVATSGSTGLPKIVIARHLGLVNRVCWALATFPFRDGDVTAHRAHLPFVDAISEMLVPLVGGCPIVVVPEPVARDNEELSKLLERERVTHLLLTPSQLNSMLLGPHSFADRLASLRHLAVSGETLGVDLARATKEALPNLRLVNIYGSSEVSGDATWHEIPDGTQIGSRVPVGVPLANTAVHVLDSRGRLVQPGARGEIVVSGHPVAAGYLEGTAVDRERFVEQLPFADGRAFRTGDIGWLNAAGELEYDGRRDRETKIRGGRVDLEAVEFSIRQLDGVLDVAVVAVTRTASASLEAHVIVDPGVTIDELQSRLRATMPRWEVPSRLVVVESLPRTPSGKLDRARLVASSPSRPSPELNALERRVAGWFESSTGLVVDDPSVDFFAIGGDSLNANLVVGLAREELGIGISISDFLAEPTVSGFGRACADALAAAVMTAGIGDGTERQQDRSVGGSRAR